MKSQSAPKSAPETAAKWPEPSVPQTKDELVDLDTIHAAWLAGFDFGYAQGRQAAAEDLARAILQEQADAMQDSAVRIATERYGPAWAQAMAEQAQGGA